MKSYLFLPLVLLCGLVVGGWGARVELRKTKEALAEARKLVKDGGKGRSGVGMAGVTQLLNIDRNDNSSTGKSTHVKEVRFGMGRPRHSSPGDATNDVSVKDEGAPTMADGQETAKEEPEQDEDGKTKEERLNERIDKAMDVWRVRSDIARKTFVEKTGLNEEQAVQFDTLVDAMNVRLASTIEQWTVGVEGKEDVGPEDGIRLVNGVTDAMVSAYEDMDRNMPDNWRDTSGQELNMTDFIDPEVARPLVKVESKMENIRPRGGPGAGGGQPPIIR